MFTWSKCFDLCPFATSVSNDLLHTVSPLINLCPLLNFHLKCHLHPKALLSVVVLPLEFTAQGLVPAFQISPSLWSVSTENLIVQAEVTCSHPPELPAAPPLHSVLRLLLAKEPPAASPAGCCWTSGLPWAALLSLLMNCSKEVCVWVDSNFPVWHVISCGLWNSVARPV